MSVTSSPSTFADPLANTGSPSSFVDPLADGVLTPPSLTQASEPAVRDNGPIARDRAALLAPDVAGLPGADAIDLVRSSGLIAAIETAEVADDSQQGIVLEQDPPVGTQMVREGVLTLSIAQAPTEPQDTGDDGPEAQSQPEASTAAHDADNDDTEQWFATLVPTLGDPASEEPDTPRPPRRHRKHRLAPVPTADASARVEIPPEPPSAPCDPPTEDQPNPSPQIAEPGLLASLIVALLVRLPAFSASRAWRRRALIFAAAIVGLLLFTRAGASHSHHQSSASLATAPISHPRVVASRASAHPRNGFAAGRLPRTPRPSSPAAPRESVATVAGATHPIATASTPSEQSSEPAPGPFAYLGK